MRVVPSGRFPAASLAAAILNAEQGVAQYDLRLSSQQGRLVALPQEKRKPIRIEVVANGIPMELSCETRLGVIYLTPMKDAGKSTTKSFLDGVEAMIEGSAEDLAKEQSHLVPVRGAYHERLYTSRVLAKRQFVIFDNYHDSAPDAVAFSSSVYTWFVFTDPIWLWEGVGRSPRGTWAFQITALIQDHTLSLDSLAMARPASWVPTYTDLNLPRFFKKDGLSLTIFSAENLSAENLSAENLPAGYLPAFLTTHLTPLTGLWADSLSALPRLTDHYSPAEAQYITEHLRAEAHSCSVCELPLFGKCGLATHGNGLFPLCRICTPEVRGISTGEVGTIRERVQFTAIYQWDSFRPMEPTWLVKWDKDEKLWRAISAGGADGQATVKYFTTVWHDKNDIYASRSLRELGPVDILMINCVRVFGLN